MATIKNTATGQSYPLRAHHTFGRNADAVDSAITGELVSRIHAAVEWNGSQWLIRDLSRNGTWLDAQPLPARQSIAVATGQPICFGVPDSSPWILIDEVAPHSLLEGTNTETDSILLKPFTFLPNESNPEIVVTFSHKLQEWVRIDLNQTDSGHMELPLQHGAVLSCGQQHWRVFLAESADATNLHLNSNQKLEEFEFIFDLSLDEENTGLRLENHSDTVNLGERSHHYLLLHLARKRAMEAGDGIDPKSQGWINTEQLSKDLGMEMSHINIQIYRARQQLARQTDDLVQLDNLVERGRGRIRFGCPRFRIYKGQELTYTLPPVDILSSR